MSKPLAPIQCKFTCNLALLIQKAQELGYTIKITEMWRTQAQEAEKVSEGLSKTMNSMHLFGTAADIALFKDGNLVNEIAATRPLGEYWESIGGRWGGRFGIDFSDYASKIGWDPFHFELHYDG